MYINYNIEYKKYQLWFMRDMKFDEGSFPSSIFLKYVLFYIKEHREYILLYDANI